jgi:hypothetical protein
MSVVLIAENDVGIFTDILTFSVTLSETHTGVSEITKFPVEVGVAVSDHIRATPKTLAAEVFVSNHPIEPVILKARGSYRPHRLDLPVPFDFPRLFRGPLIASPGAGTRALVNLAEGRMVPPIVNVTTLTFDAFDVVGETYSKLESMRVSGVRLRVVTSLSEYSDMYLTAVNAPRTAEDGSGATFQIALEQVRKVSPLSVTAPAIPLEPNGAPKKNRGGAATVLVDDEQAQKKRRSLALQAVQGLLEAAE